MSWLRKCKRRRGGVYVWRTRKHAHPWARETAYVGRTRSFKRRERDHRGASAYQRSDGKVEQTTEKPWMDLEAKMYRVIRVPWWLCWTWVLDPLETLVILILWPRYNDKKNRWNPRRVPISRQWSQRAARDAKGGMYRARVTFSIWMRYGVQAFAVVLILTGIVGAVVNQ